MNYFNVITLIISIFVLNGCITTQKELALKKELKRLNGRVNQMEYRLSSSTGKIIPPPRSEDGSGKDMADLNSKLIALEEQMTKLSGENEEFRMRLEELKKNYDTIDQRIAKLESRPVEIPKPIEEKAESKEQKDAADKKASADKQFAKALAKFKDKKYKEAKDSFEEFLEAHPKHKFVTNALFWLAESHKELNNCAKANIEFNKVIESEDPSSLKILAKLHTADCYVKLGGATYLDAAKTYYQDVITNHPNSSEAKKAKQSLKNLSKKK